MPTNRTTLGSAARADDPAKGGVVLAPAARLMWRGNDTAHLELGSRAVTLSGVSPGQVARLVDPHASASAPQSDRHSPSSLPPTGLDAAFDALLRDGYLWPRGCDTPDPRSAGDGTRTADPSGSGDPRRRPPVPRLAGELTAVSVRHGSSAAAVLAARASTRVVVHGGSRIAVQLAALLAAAGVGRVVLVTPAIATRLNDAVPGGLRPRDEGRPMSAAAQDAVRVAAPEVDTTPLAPDDVADLTVVVLDAPIDDDRRESLHADGAAHLAVAVGPDRGVVGPLVLPGLTGCLGCAELHRQDRDPAWPALAVQLSIPSRYGPASDAATTTAIAGLAGIQALAFLDGDQPACVDATLELAAGDWRVRRRSWPAHPRCSCRSGRW